MTDEFFTSGGTVNPAEPSDPIQLFSPYPGVLEVMLNRPNRCNAFSAEMLDALGALLDQLKNRSEYRILILTGAGNCFCSGLDLSEAFSGGSVDRTAPAYQMPKKVTRVLRSILTLPQTTVAAANGPAFGGGGGLIAVSDYVTASGRFRIGFPELFRGLAPALLHPFLSRKFSASALKMLHYAPWGISAEEAQRLELVQRVVPEEELMERTLEFVQTLLSAEPGLLAQMKASLNESRLPPAEEIEAGLEKHWESWRSEQAQEGIRAFLEKRKPVWP